MLDAADVGHRVSVRRRVEGGLTDVVGHLLECAPDRLEVLRASGERVRLDPSAVTAAKRVPPAAPVRRGWALPELSPAEMQRICEQGWPARETAQLGQWRLRASAGVTERANSVLAIGDPSVALPEALDTVRTWYAARSLTPRLQLPLPDATNLELESLGWRRTRTPVVQVAPIAPLLDTLPSRPDLRPVVQPEPSADWLGLFRELSATAPQMHLALLTSPSTVGFLTLLAGSTPVGVGRVVVVGEWAGVTCVDVPAEHRRSGVGTALLRHALAWGAGQGARWSYLQVLADNDPALRLYAGHGYVTHHVYTYREPAVPD